MKSTEFARWSDGRLRFVPAVAVVLGLVLAGCAVAGAPPRDAAHLEASGPPFVAGDLEAWSRVGAFVATAPDNATAPARLEGQADAFRLQVVRVTVRVVSGPSGPEVHQVLDHRVEHHNYTDAAFVVTPEQSTFRFLLHTTGPSGDGNLSMAADGLANAELPVQAESFEYVYKMRSEYPVHYQYVPETPLVGVDRVLGDAPITLTGNFTGFVAGASLAISYDGGTEHLRLTEENKTVRDPITGHPVERIHRYAFAHVETEGLAARGNPTAWPPATLLLANPAYGVDGSLALQDARGSVRVDDERHALTGQPIILEGKLGIRLRSADAAAPPPVPGLAEDAAGGRYTVHGSFSTVWIDGARVHDGHPGFASAAAAVSAATLAAALLAGARATVGAAAGAFYTRLNGSNVLHNPVRRRILREVAEMPGLHLRSLQRRCGCGWGTLNYHVAVLVREKHIHLVKRGKHKLAFVAEDTDGAHARFLNLKGAAADVYAALRPEGSTTQKQLADAVGISRQLVSYHLRQLERDGLVRSVGGWPRRYVRTGAADRSTAADAPASGRQGAASVD